MMKTEISQVEIPEGKSTLPIILLGDRILIKPIKLEQEEKYKGTSLVIPETANSAFAKGTIVCCGDGNSHNKIGLICGSVILYNPASAADVIFKGDMYDMIRDSDVVMIL